MSVLKEIIDKEIELNQAIASYNSKLKENEENEKIRLSLEVENKRKKLQADKDKLAQETSAKILELDKNYQTSKAEKIKSFEKKIETTLDKVILDAIKLITL